MTFLNGHNLKNGVLTLQNNLIDHIENHITQRYTLYPSILFVTTRGGINVEFTSYPRFYHGMNNLVYF